MMFPEPVKYPWEAWCSGINMMGLHARDARKIRESSFKDLMDINLKSGSLATISHSRKIPMDRITATGTWTSN